METIAIGGYLSLFSIGIPVSWCFFFWAMFCSAWLRVPCLLYAFWFFWDWTSMVTGQRSGFGGVRRECMVALKAVTWKIENTYFARQTTLHHLTDMFEIRSPWVRNWGWWRLVQGYFPVTLVKTSELPPDQSYLFATFPHGILSVGAFSSFATESCSFKKVFPGLTSRLATLKIYFVTPFTREIFLSLGCLPADESCIVRGLGKKGNALCLVVGGIEEIFHSKPGQYDIIVKRRKGFIRVALKSGAYLVPTILFGEPEVYDQIHFAPGSFMRWVQNTIKKVTGLYPVLLKGRGILRLLPFRTPVTVVVGKPISVPKEENPTKSQIDELHAIFCEELTTLFNREKEKYLKKSTELHII